MSIPGSELLFSSLTLRNTRGLMTDSPTSSSRLCSYLARYAKLISCLISFHREYLRVDRIDCSFLSLFFLSLFPRAGEFLKFGAIFFFSFFQISGEKTRIPLPLRRKGDSKVGFVYPGAIERDRFLNSAKRKNSGFGLNGASLA